MELLSQPQISSAVLAGALFGGLVLVLLILSDRAIMQRALFKSGKKPADADDDRVVFLFAGQQLIQSTQTAKALLDHDWDGEEPETRKKSRSDWDIVRNVLGCRFPDLPESPGWANGSGQMTLEVDRGLCTDHLLIDWWNGHTRLTLIEGLPRQKSSSASGPQIDEAGWLRQAVTEAPYPIWQSNKTGNILWANSAYRDLVARFRKETFPHDACPSLFAFPHHNDSENTAYRVSVTPEGSVQPYWFDVRALRLETGWMNYATDVNAVVNAEIAQRNFVQTLTKTFAQLSIGLAIFDRKRQLALFNPALIDLTSLPAEFLSARPNLLSFFDRLRDRQMMPEPKNYRSWRDQIADLVAAADNGQYRETWSLPSGLTYRISGRPHPDGAVAFLFEDISAEISLTRRFRSQLELGQSVLNTLNQSIAVFSASGVMAFSNTAYHTMWGMDPDSSFTDISVTDASRQWQAGSLPTPVWGDLRDFIVQFGERTDWQASVTLRDGQAVTCQVVPMSGGATLVLFHTCETLPVPALGDLLHSLA
jgi:PAS domain-containing protein